MELVRVTIPGGGELEALRFQDLPAEHVIAFMGMEPGYKELMAKRLFTLAAGEAGENAIRGMTFAELEHTINEWMLVSVKSSEVDEDGRGSGLDWDSSSV
jgi:hypothetical protein